MVHFYQSFHKIISACILIDKLYATDKHVCTHVQAPAHTVKHTSYVVMQ